MTFNKKLIAVVLITILLVGITTLLTFQKKTSEQKIHKVTSHKGKIVSLEQKGFRTQAVIAGIGDILIHDWVYEDAKTQNGYNFNPMFEPVHSLLQKPDFLIANQESTPGGTEIGISNYPSFNSPYEIVDALMEAGVDMVTTANNHSLDRGEKALLSAIKYYEEKNLPYTGTFKSPEDKKDMRIITVNGIKIAVLSYATHLNGIPIPEGKEHLVNMLDPKQVLLDIDEAKAKSDVVLLALHWGDEYVRQPNETQTDLAKQFIDAGADIIFGHHPHVLQPMEWIDRPDGKRGLVIYSLGNFLSGQLRNYKDIGGMAEVTIKKELSEGETIISIENPVIHPTFSSSKQFRTYRVYPLDEANEKGLTNHTSEEIQKFFSNK